MSCNGQGPRARVITTCRHRGKIGSFCPGGMRADRQQHYRGVKPTSTPRALLRAAGVDLWLENAARTRSSTAQFARSGAQPSVLMILIGSFRDSKPSLFRVALSMSNVLAVRLRDVSSANARVATLQRLLHQPNPVRL